MEVGDLVLCTVEKIERTTVFVKISNNFGDEKEIDSSIIFSEISPGRIRNIRDYVVPKKKIICKILRITSFGNVELSLRRVSQKESKEFLEKHNQERNYAGMIKSILGEKSKKIIEEIKKEGSLYDFFNEAKENPKKLEKLFQKEELQKITNSLKTQKKKKITLKKEIELKSKKPNGLEIIKEILSKSKDCEIIYLGGGKYIIKRESEDAKSADKKINEFLMETERSARKLAADFKILG